MSRFVEGGKAQSFDVDLTVRSSQSYVEPVTRAAGSRHFRSTSSDVRFRPYQIPEQFSRAKTSMIQHLLPPLTAARRSPPDSFQGSSRPNLLSTPRLPPPLPDRSINQLTPLKAELSPLRTPDRRSPPLAPPYVQSSQASARYWRVRETTQTKPSPNHNPQAIVASRNYRAPSALHVSARRSPSPEPFRIGPKTYDPLRPEGLYQASKGAQRDIKWRKKQNQASSQQSLPAPTSSTTRDRAAPYVARKIHHAPEKVQTARASVAQILSARQAQLEAIHQARVAEGKKSLRATVQNQVYSHARPTRCHWTGCEAQCTSWALLEKHLACCHLHCDNHEAVDAEGRIVCGWAKEGEDMCGRTFDTKQDCLAHCIAKDGHMGEYDSRCPYNCTTNKRTFSDLMGHIAKHHRSATSPTVPLLLPTQPKLTADLLPPSGRLLLHNPTGSITLSEGSSPAEKSRSHTRLVKPSCVSARTRAMVAAKEERDVCPDDLHSLPNQKAAGAALTALTKNARKRRRAINELRSRDPTSDLLPPPSVFVANELYQMVANLMTDDEECSDIDNLDRLLRRLNSDGKSDSIVHSDMIPSSAIVRLDGRTSSRDVIAPESKAKARPTSRRTYSNSSTKASEPPYDKVDVKKLFKEVKTAVWQSQLARGPRNAGSGRTRRSRNGTDPTATQPPNIDTHHTTIATSVPPIQPTLSAPLVRAKLGLMDLLSADLGPAENGGQQARTVTTNISLSETSPTMTIGTTGSSAFLPTPSSGRSRSSSPGTSSRNARGFGISSERRQLSVDVCDESDEDMPLGMITEERDEAGSKV